MISDLHGEQFITDETVRRYWDAAYGDARSHWPLDADATRVALAAVAPDLVQVGYDQAWREFETELRTMRRNIHHLLRQAQEHHEDARAAYDEALEISPLQSRTSSLPDARTTHATHAD